MGTVILHILDIMEWLDYHHVFSIWQMFNDLEIRNTKLNIEFCEKVLEYNKIAYRFGEDGLWVSRQSLFKEMQFTIILTNLEHKKEILIPGSRFTPYTNHFFRYRVMELMYKGKRIKQKMIPLTFREIKEYYYLCPERELLSILESFEMNIVEEDIVDDDDIFYVPAYNIKQFYKDLCLNDDEQIVLEVFDWGQVKIELVGKTPCKVSKAYKKKWEVEFKELLQKALNVRSSENYLIEDIFAFMLYSNPRLFFHDKDFISLESYLKDSDLLENIDFGVRDKLWIKDSPIILPKEWFQYVYGIPNIIQISNADDDFLCSIGSLMTLGILRLAIYSVLDENYVKINETPDEVESECIKLIIKDFFSLKKYKLHHKKIATLIKKEYLKCVEKYTPFRDREVILLSFSVLQLFKRMFSIVSYIEEKKLLLDRIDFSVVIMLDQFAEDASPLLKMTEELFNVLQDADVEEKIQEVSIVRDKFGNFLDNVEDYIFSSF